MLHLIALHAALAQPVDPFQESDESELYRLDEGLVTVASRYAQTVAQAPSIVTVIDGDTLRERGYRTLSDALADLPGVYVWRNAEGRALSSFRGVVASDNNKVLLLIDGVPWYDGVYTHAAIDDYLPIGHIQQIEVIKGPGSAIYGTNAFAGVINVVTWGASGLQGARFRAIAGADGRTDVILSGGGSERVAGMEVGLSAYARSLRSMGAGLDVGPDNRRNVLGQDPREGVAAGARLTVQDLTVQIHHVDFRETYLTRQFADSPFQVLAADPETTGVHYHDTYLDLRYAWQVSRNTVITPYLGSQRFDDPGTYFFFTGISGTDDDADGVVDSELGYQLVETEKVTRRMGYGVDADLRPGIDHHVLLGAGVEQTSVLELADYVYADGARTPTWTGYGIPEEAPGEGVEPGDFRDPTQANARLCNAFAFGQYEWIPAPGVELVAGGRIDRRYTCGPDVPGVEDGELNTGFAASPRVALLLVPSGNVTAKVLYGEAFRYGTVREVLVRAGKEDTGEWLFTDGSPGLLPERIRTAEAEVRAKLGSPFEFGLDGAYSVVVNEIDKGWIVQPTEPADAAAGWGSKYVNADGQLRIASAQADVIARPSEAIEVGIAYAGTFATYRGGAADGRAQYEFPPHMFKGHVRLAPTDHLSATLNGQAYTSRPRADWAPNSGNNDGKPFGVLHLAVAMDDLGPEGQVQVVGGVRNLTATDYGTGVYRDQIDEVRNDAARYPEEIAGEPRTVHVGIEVAL